MKFYLLIFFISIFLFQTFAQDGNNVLVVTKAGMKNIPAYVREGTVYFSLKDFNPVSWSDPNALDTTGNNINLSFFDENEYLLFIFSPASWKTNKHNN